MAPSFFRSPSDVSSSGDSSPTREARSSGQQTPRDYPRQRDGARPPVSRALSRVASSVQVPTPQLEPQEQMHLFHLSLMEGRCKTQAMNTINASRPPDQQVSEDDPEVLALTADMFADMSRDLVNAGFLSPGYAGPDAAALRSQLLERFDNMLQSSAQRKTNNLDQSFGGDNSSDLGIESIAQGTGRRRQSLSNMLSSTGGIAHPTSLVRTASALTRQLAPAPAMILGQQNGFLVSSSTYNNEYQQICMLGKGGYGSVYKVRNNLDCQEYAIKKIIISSQRLQKIREMAQIDALLAELRTLAKLNHPNTVRYYHGWLETSSGEVLTSRPNESDPILDSESAMLSHLQLEDATIEEHDEDEVSKFPSISKDNVTEDDGIIFGYSTSKGQSEGLLEAAPRQRDRRSSHATTSSTLTHRTSVKSVGEDGEDSEEAHEEDVDEIESIPRSFSTPSHLQNRQLKEVQSPKRIFSDYVGPDVTLFIKMSLHQSNLASYLYPEIGADAEHRHCFHLQPTVGLLSALLNGVEYLHSQRIVHRDLKPANIFLTISDKPSTREGFVNVGSCTSCSGKESKPSYVTPCIGDFGLIAEIKDCDKAEEPPIFESSALAKLSAKPVGTQFYRPQTMPSTEPVICEKLDIYSIGVIAFEMLYRFGTKSERAMVLSALNTSGKLPEGFTDEEVAEGIKSMVCEDRDERWGCAEVRSWLTKLEKRFAV